MKKYCIACGRSLDAEGICSNENCKRRALQIAAKTAKTLATSKDETNQTARIATRSTLKADALSAAKAKARALSL